MKTSIISFSKSTLIYSLGTIALRFTSFLLIPLYTSYLTVAEFGLLQTLLFTIQVIITINDLGLRSALIRFFPDYENSGKLKDLIGSTVLLLIITSLILFGISILIPDSVISEIFNIDVISNIIIITLLAGIAQTLSLNILSYFRATDKSGIYMIIGISTSLSVILLTYIFLVILNLGIKGVLYAQIISFGLMWIFTLIWITLKHGISVNYHAVQQLFKFGSPLIFAMSGDIIVNTYGSYQLGATVSLEAVAIFSLAYKIALVAVMVLIGPFQMAYEPYVFRNKSNPELKKIISKMISYALLSFLILSSLLLFTFKDLIKILGNSNYFSAYYLIFFLLPGIGITIFNYVGQSLLHLNNKTKTTGSIILLCTIATLFASYFLIKYFAIYGLVISINLYLITSSMIIFFFGLKELRIVLELKRIGVIIILLISIFCSIYLLSFYSNTVYYLSVSAIFITFAILLYNSGFFNSTEKESIKRIITDIRSKLA